MKLENWALMVNFFTYPVDRTRVNLCGEVYGHPTRLDGTTIFTSSIVDIKNNLVVTKSGSRYELGKPEAKYEAAFPNAKERVLNREWKTYHDK